MEEEFLNLDSNYDNNINKTSPRQCMSSDDLQYLNQGKKSFRSYTSLNCLFNSTCISFLICHFEFHVDDWGYNDHFEFDSWSVSGESCCSGYDGDELNLQAESLSELYPGSSFTVREFVTCFGFSKTSLGQPDSHADRLLKFISMVLPQPNKCPSSLYRFKKHFEEDDLLMQKHYYCSECTSLTQNLDYDIDNDEAAELDEVFENINACDCSDKKQHFIQIPILRQLKSFYHRPGFYNKLKSTVDHRSGNENEYLSDIYDGLLYRELSNDNILSNNNNISLMWYTDGVRIFKSSKYNIWVFFFIH